MDALLAQPYTPLLAWTVGIALVVQLFKRITVAARVRHHPVVERTLALWGAAVGIVSGAAAPHELGVGLLIDNGHHSMHALGAFFGAGVGLVSSGVFRAVLDLAPESLRESLTLPERGGGSSE